jgi:hypothetical protein
MRDHFTKIGELAGSYATSVDVTTTLTVRTTTICVSATLKPHTPKDLRDDSTVRQQLFESAQKLIASVEAEGYVHKQPPAIFIDGEVVSSLAEKPSHIVSGVLELELGANA